MPDLDLHRAEAELADGNPRTLAQRALRYEGEVSNELERTRHIITAVREEHRERWEAWNGLSMPEGMQPRLDMVDARNRAIFIIAALVAFGLESMVASYLSIFLLSLPTYYAVIVGLTMVFTLGTAVRAGAAAMNDVERPRHSRDRIRWWAIGCSILTIAAIATFYGARTYPWLAFTVAGSLTAQALALPFAGACWLELAAQTDTLNRLVRQFRRLSRRLLALERLAKIIRSVIDTATPPLLPPAGEPPTNERPAPYTGPLMSALIAGLVLFGTVNADAASIPSCFAIGADVSGSLEPRECERVLKSLADNLPQLVKLTGDQIKSVSIKKWSAGPQIAGGPDRVATLPALPTVTMPPLVPDEQWIINGIIATQREEWRMICKARREAALEEYHAQITERLAEIQEELESIDPQKQAPATCIDQALTRFSQLSGGALSVIVSDGQQANCPTHSSKDEPVPQNPDAEVVLVLVPSRADGNDVLTRMEARRNRLAARFPRLRIVRSFDIGGIDDWKRVLGLEQTGVDRAESIVDCVNPPTTILDPTAWARP